MEARTVELFRGSDAPTCSSTGYPFPLVSQYFFRNTKKCLPRIDFTISPEWFSKIQNKKRLIRNEWHTVAEIRLDNRIVALVANNQSYGWQIEGKILIPVLKGRQPSASVISLIETPKRYFLGHKHFSGVQFYAIIPKNLSQLQKFRIIPSFQSNLKPTWVSICNDCPPVKSRSR